MKTKAMITEIPHPTEYGALELKVYARKYSFRGLMFTIGLLVSICVGFLSSQKAIELSPPLLKNDKVETITINLPPLTKADDVEILSVPSDLNMTPSSGPATVAGDPVPIEDEIFKIAETKVPDFASFTELGKSGGTAGDGSSDRFVKDVKTSSLQNNLPVQTALSSNYDENVPDFVEIEPEIDLAKLSSLIKYPRLAVNAKVEGMVLLTVIIDELGDLKKVSIFSSDNLMLEGAAIDAVKKYGKFTPAMQNGKPTACRVIIPVKFSLK